jgi:hypothetical protein
MSGVDIMKLPRTRIELPANFRGSSLAILSFEMIGCVLRPTVIYLRELVAQKALNRTYHL